MHWHTPLSTCRRRDAHAAGHFVKTNPELGLTERAATRIIDLLLDKPGVTDESRRSPDSVMSFEPRAFAPATVAASAASAASAAAIVAAAVPPNDHGLRRVPRLRPNIGTHSAPRSAPATPPRTQPFLPIGAHVGVPRSASAMGRETPPPSSRGMGCGYPIWQFCRSTTAADLRHLDAPPLACKCKAAACRRPHGRAIRGRARRIACSRRALPRDRPAATEVREPSKVLRF